MKISNLRYYIYVSEYCDIDTLVNAHNEMSARDGICH